MSHRSHIQLQDCIQPQRPKGSQSPNAGSFQKGRSGNPKGRPRGTGKHAEGSSAYEAPLIRCCWTRPSPRPSAARSARCRWKKPSSIL
ncbi:DUF5681 domain-containing protein [Bradyrhizobium liaoningense]|uniref:DUF5681 domain-containing protein n=1 Tax=Bradyrhizobium liaoningense TaxID=43992 RepID=UPI003D9B2640